MDKTIQNPLMLRFFEDCRKYIQQVKIAEADPSFAIKPGMAEWTLWEEYLMNRIGVLPWAMRETTAGRITSCTMPARYPYWFDAGYVQPAPRPQAGGFIGEDERRRVSEGLERLGAELSMGRPEAERRYRERRARGTVGGKPRQ